MTPLDVGWLCLGFILGMGFDWLLWKQMVDMQKRVIAAQWKAMEEMREEVASLVLMQEERKG
jgi:hypothetical protein